MRYIFLFLSFSLLFSACQSSESSTEEATRNANAPVMPEADRKEDQKRIIFFGNSLTAAYGLDPEQGFVALIQQKIDSLGLNYKAVNAGLSGETTAGGKERIDWILKQPVDIFVLELGGNDGLRGIDPGVSIKNLEAIIKSVQEAYPEAKIVLAGMEAPPNMGKEFTSEFRQMYPRLAKSYDLALIPFLLENVGGIAELNQRDGIHPNAEGQRIVAENVWKVLEPIL